jgi:hypothetical protein
MDGIHDIKFPRCFENTRLGFGKMDWVLERWIGFWKDGLGSTAMGALYTHASPIW